MESDDSRVRLEMLVAHLERELQAMNDVVLDLQREIRSLVQKQGQLEARLIRMAEPPEERDALAERPPHY